MTPSALDCVGVSASLLVNQLSAMVDSSVCVTLRVQIAVCTPAITDDRSAGLDPCIYNGHQSVGVSFWNGNKKHFTGLALNTAKHPLPLNRVAPVIFALTEPSLIDLDCLVRTADLGAALRVHEHGLPSELAPVRNHSRTEAILLFDKGGRFVAHNVIREKHYLLESYVTVLKP